VALHPGFVLKWSEGGMSNYGFDFCPAFWEWLDAKNRSDTVFSIEKVRDELIGGGDELAEWARQRGVRSSCCGVLSRRRSTRQHP
jgi:hypothetical protein